MKPLIETGERGDREKERESWGEDTKRLKGTEDKTWQIRASSVCLWSSKILKGEICFLPSNPRRRLIKSLSRLVMASLRRDGFTGWNLCVCTCAHTHAHTQTSFNSKARAYPAVMLSCCTNCSDLQGDGNMVDAHKNTHWFTKINAHTFTQIISFYSYCEADWLIKGFSWRMNKNIKALRSTRVIQTGRSMRMITEEKKKRQWAGKERDSSCRKYKRDHKEQKAKREKLKRRVGRVLCETNSLLCNSQKSL